MQLQDKGHYSESYSYGVIPLFNLNFLNRMMALNRGALVPDAVLLYCNNISWSLKLLSFYNFIYFLYIYYIFFMYSLDTEFTKALKEYVEQGYKKDSVSMNVGDSELHEFTNVLEVAAGGLKRYVYIYNIYPFSEGWWVFYYGVVFMTVNFLFMQGSLWPSGLELFM